MKSRQFIAYMSKRYPKRLTPWKQDRIGLFVNKLKNEINKVVVTLDCDIEAVNLALQENADLIISHHPLLYPSKKEALSHTEINEVYRLLVKQQIPLLCLHSNFDIASNGMNTNFGLLLELHNIHQYRPNQFLFIGELEREMNICEFIPRLKEKLNIDYVLYQLGKANNNKIKVIGFTLGGAAEEYLTAVEAKVDLYISGDSAHHERRSMYQLNLNYLELGHEVEQTIFIPTMQQVINDIEPSIKVITSFNQKILSKF
jgi:dinuclear metal center YbgI/SA1388 family protein